MEQLLNTFCSLDLKIDSSWNKTNLHESFFGVSPAAARSARNWSNSWKWSYLLIHALTRWDKFSNAHPLIHPSTTFKICQSPDGLTVHVVIVCTKPELFQAFPRFPLLSSLPGWPHHHPKSKTVISKSFSWAGRSKARTLKLAKLGARLAGSEEAPRAWVWHIILLFRILNNWLWIDLPEARRSLWEVPLWQLVEQQGTER